MAAKKLKRLGRRDFLALLGGVAIGSALAPHLIPPSFAGALSPGRLDRPELAAGRFAEVKYYQKLADGRVHCSLCPYECVLVPGQTCPCRTRTNHDGVLLNHSFANPCVVNLDPIEMLPMNHFLPGSTVLAMGLAGCNLRCAYCQNWQVSQKRPEETQNVEMPQQEAIVSVRKKKLAAIAFTYTEPVVFSEYVLAVSQAARAQGIPVVIATSAYMNKAPLIELCKHVKAFTVTLKAFNDEFYRRVCGVRLQPVLDSLATIKSRGNWLEVVNLIIPNENDSAAEIEQMSRWLRKNLGESTPLHFLRFVPEYMMRNVPRTPLETLEAARKTALSCGLKHVYISNVAPHEGNNTYCPNCSSLLIERVGYKILSNRLRGSKCPYCSTAVAGIWAGGA